MKSNSKKTVEFKCQKSKKKKRVHVEQMQQCCCCCSLVWSDHDQNPISSGCQENLSCSYNRSKNVESLIETEKNLKKEVPSIFTEE